MGGAYKRTIVTSTLAAGAGLAALGVGDRLGEAWGWGLFLVSALLLSAGTGAGGILLFSKRLHTVRLKTVTAWLLILGAVFYVWGIFGLGGFYLFETLEGRMETRWVVFGIAILAAIIVLDAGLYRIIVARNLPTWRRFGQFVTRQDSDPVAMRRTLVDEVVLHKSLFSVSGFRWFKHTLIFWGFGLLFATECLAVVFRDMLPAFGRADLWMADHPLRLAFDFAFDAFGLMSMAGCVLALIWRVMVNGTEQQKFTDTPTALFLFFVLLSGFLVEGLRIAGAPPDPFLAVSFVGYGLALLMGPAEAVLAGLSDPLWYAHVIGSCLFIAYIPVKRLVHSCATPMGRLMNSQKGLLEAKRKGVVSGLLGGWTTTPE
jgi:nitrate reductase gamma subunit